MKPLPTAYCLLPTAIMLLRSTIQRMRSKPLVRPWALAAPTLVLLIALPLLRPLRHPLPSQISDGEKSRLATVQSIVERHTLSIDRGLFRDTADRIVVSDHYYSDQPPMMAALLSPAYWTMRHFGWTFESNPVLVAYLLTLLGVTLPAALATGLIYRMGRLFELPRKWRTGLAMIVAFGSGLISYAVVLNPHVPAAALVLASAACLIHVSASKNLLRSLPFTALAGLCATTAAAIDLPAAAFLFLLPFVILSMRIRLDMRVAGLALYALGALPALALHGALVRPLTGDLLPPTLHPELVEVPRAPLANVAAAPAPANSLLDKYLNEEDWTDPEPSWLALSARNAVRILAALFGSHGLLSHFPIVILGLFGIGKVMHRHWPTSTKALAVATISAAGAILVICALWKADWARAMFAARWFIVFLPLLLFWSGAWMRKHHHPAKWALVSILLAFSILVSLIGATDPVPRSGYQGYTAAAALQELLQPRPPVVSDQAFASEHAREL